ncbi:MAG: hypothetical protein ACI9EA_001645, partial [Pseudomonadales bacterium]
MEKRIVKGCSIGLVNLFVSKLKYNVNQVTIASLAIFMSLVASDVMTQVNDAFAFFVSGSGISGPYSGGAENLAVLPDLTPVAINSVNNDGNVITVNQNVIIDDVTDTLTPTLADVTGQCTATALVPTTTDASAGTITGTTTDALTYTVQGTHVITWTFDDGNGNVITADQNVIIDDTTNPATPILADVAGQCTGTAVSPTTSDNCDGVITGTTTYATTYTAQGTHVITWTFTDGNGNSITANQNVIINDTIDPIIPVLADVTGECTATVVAPTTTDNCVGTLTSIQGVTDLSNLYDELIAYPGGVSHGASFGNGETLSPGVYDMAAAFSMAGTLTLDGGGDPNSVFIMRGTGAFIITASTTVVLTGNAKPENIFWVSDGAISIGASTIMKGTMIATGAIVSGASSEFEGRLFSRLGAVSVVVDVILTIPTGTAPFNLGDLSTFAMWSSSGAVSDVASSTTTGDVGNASGALEMLGTHIGNEYPGGTRSSPPITGTTTDATTYTAQGTYVITWTFTDENGNSITANQNVIISDAIDPVTGECAATAVAPTRAYSCLGALISIQGVTDLCNLYDELMAYPGGVPHVAVFGNGETLFPGVYDMAAAFSIAGILTLDGGGDPNSVFIMRGTGALTAAASTTVVLTGNAKPENIFWVSGAAISIGASTIMKGTMIGGGIGAGAIVLGASIEFEGRLFSRLGAVSVAADVILTIPTGTPPFNLGVISTFAMWSSSGAVSDTASSTTTGDVGNASGALTMIGTHIGDEYPAGTTSSPPITGTTTYATTYTAQGTHAIIWTFTDGNGNSITANQNVIINDTTNPATPILADVTGECTATAVAPTTTDNCTGTITGTTTDLLTYTAQGTHVITWSFDDGNGNEITVNQNVIIDDVTDP